MNVNRMVLAIVWLITWVPVTAQHSGELKNAHMQQVMDLIQRETGLMPSYMSDAVTGWKPFTFSVKNVSKPMFLFRACEGQKFSYRIINGCFSFVSRVPVDAAQPQPVSYNGFVTDSENNPIPLATIYLLHANDTIHTMPSGEFYFEALPGETVMITNTYFDTLYITLSPDQLNIVRLRRQVQPLNDVEVLHNGIKNANMTGSYRKVDYELLRRNPGSNLMDRLEMLGLLLTKNFMTGTNQPTWYQLDARVTLFSSPDMLVIVDGFPYTGNLRDINPATVKSVTVLRDAAAASIWGSGAGNGVIVIELKKPADDKRLHINFDYSLFAGRKPNVFASPQMSSRQLVNLQLDLYDQGFYNMPLNSPVWSTLSDVVEMKHRIANKDPDSLKLLQAIERMKDQDVRNDIDDILIHNSLGQQMALNVSQKKGSWSYLFMGSIFKASPFSRGSSKERRTGSVYLDWEIDKKLKVAGRIDYASYFTKNMDGFKLYLGKPTTMVDSIGQPLVQQYLYRPSYVNKHKHSGLYSMEYFPLQEVWLTNNTTTDVNKRYWFDVQYALNDTWTLQAKYQLQQSEASWLNNENEYSFNTRNLLNNYADVGTGVVKYAIPPGDILRGGSWTQSANNLRLQVLYKKRGRSKINTEIVTGVDLRSVHEKETALLLYGVKDGRAYDQAKINFTDSFRQFTSGARLRIPAQAAPIGIRSTFTSLFSEGEFTYDDRFTASLGARLDQSAFKEIDITIKPAFFYSAGGGWNIHHETFYRLTWLPLLKLRASYGINGNGNTQQNAISAANPEFINPYRNRQTGAGKNVSLRWEQVKMFNAGIDFQLGKNWKGSVDAYQKTGTDLLAHTGTGAAPGTYTMNNAAKIGGKGINASLHASFKYNRWTWQAGTLFSYARNTVRNYPNRPIEAWKRAMPQYLTVSNDEELYTLKSFKVFGNDSLGNPIVWKNGDDDKTYTEIALDTTMKYLVTSGPSVPRVFGSLYTGTQWKRFTIWLQFIYKLGYYFRRRSINYPAVMYENDYGHTDFDKRWQKKGDEYHTTVPSFNLDMIGDRDKIYNLSNLLIERGDHARLQNIYASADLSDLRPFSRWFRSATFYISIENPGIVLTVTGDKTDPDYQFEDAPRISFTAGIRIDL